MTGGAPAGTNIRPGDEGCRRKRMHMSTITMQGNRTTMLRGIDSVELPFSRIRLLKNASLGVKRSEGFEKSFNVGSWEEEGKRFVRFCTRPMEARRA